MRNQKVIQQSMRLTRCDKRGGLWRKHHCTGFVVVDEKAGGEVHGVGARIVVTTSSRWSPKIDTNQKENLSRGCTTLKIVDDFESVFTVPIIFFVRDQNIFEENDGNLRHEFDEPFRSHCIAWNHMENKLADI